MNHLEDLLKDCAGAGRRLIVTDGVFSMDGDLAPLPDLATLSEKYDAVLMVDDAHATGVLGPGGRGTSEHFGLQGRVQVRMGTLGKALGSLGAYVAGSRDLVDFLVNKARSYIFSTSLPPAVCAASIAALTVVRQEPELRDRLWKNRERFVAGLRSLGISTGSSETPIIPIMIGGAEKALHAGTALFEQGIYATAIRPPSVPEGSARIRMTVTAAHSDHNIDDALAAIGRVKEKGLIP
jgi:7-keto-8-aminopelargonate synthetase-like enzyme